MSAKMPLPLEVIQRIKSLLKYEPRSLAWFTLSVNSAFRGGDILRIKFEDISFENDRLKIVVKEQKTGKLAIVLLNDEVTRVVQAWIDVHPRKTDYLFEGKFGKQNTSYYSSLLKQWCSEVGFTNTKDVATHSCRKSFCRINLERGASITTLMHSLRHSSPVQTLTYCHITQDDVQKLYDVGI